MNLLSRFRALSSPERRVLVQTVLCLPLLSLALAVLGLNRLRRLLERSTRDSPEPGKLPVQGIAALVSKAAERLPFAPSCLARSLWLHWLLRRHGIRSDLRVGVRLVEGRLDAHAWVECERVPVNDTPEGLGPYAAFEGGI